VAAEARVGVQMEARAIKNLKEDSYDLLQSVAIITGGLLLLYFGIYAKGDSIAEGLLSTFHLLPKKDLNMAIQLITGPLMTGGNVIFNLGALKTLHSTFNVFLATFSGLQSRIVSSNERKEGQGGTIGERLWTRAKNIIKGDVGDIPKAIGIGAGGL